MSIDQLMKELQVDYLKTITAKITSLEGFLESQDLPALKNEFHKMKGTGKTYGVPEITQIAAAAEELLKVESPEHVVQLAVHLLKKTKEARDKGLSLVLESSPEYQALTKS